jgi:fructokinase
LNHSKIVSIGEVLWDLFPNGAQFGGAPANFACHAAIQGAQVSMLSAVGDDPRGHEAVSILQACGIDTSLVQVIPRAATGTVGVTLDSAGKPTFAIHENSAWDQIHWTTEIATRISEADAVYFGTLGQRSLTSRATIRRAVQLAREARIPCLVDLNLRRPFFDDQMIRDSIELASILKFSDDELPGVIAACGLTSDSSIEICARKLCEKYHLSLVVMTCGADGAILATVRDVVRQPGIPTRVIDTVGAGDSFVARFLLGLLAQEPHGKTLHAACERAAKTCSHAGAVPRISESGLSNYAAQQAMILKEKVS